MRGVLSGALVLCIAVACDSAVQVGERRDVAADDAGGVVPGPVPEADAGAGVREWRLHSPAIPCTIHAMDETFSSDLYIGCSGGRVYRFDGVTSKPVLEVEDTKTFSLIWVAPDEHVFAVAQSSRDRSAKSDIHHFDGKTWSKLAAVGSTAIMALHGLASNDVWAASATEIFHFDGNAWTSRATVPSGEIRGCAFSAPDQGYCVGTQGLALAWDGSEWKPLANVPWSVEAEVLGVDFEGYPKPRAMFAYAEPASLSNGDHLCRAATYQGTFTKFSAEIPCFVDGAEARRRVGHAIVGGPVFWLVAHEATGGGLVFDENANEWRSLCAPALAFSKGSANTRVGGRYGFLGTVIGKGSNQLAVDAFGGSDREFKDLSISNTGAAWARSESTTACASSSDVIQRFDGTAWRPVGGSQAVLSGHGLSALSFDVALTIASPISDTLSLHDSEGWRDVLDLAGKNPWSLHARSETDVWIASNRDSFGHFDGTKLETLRPDRFGRQIEEIVALEQNEVWMLARGYTENDTSLHVYHYRDGKFDERELPPSRATVHLAAIDASHAWLSGAPASAWDGSKWRNLPFEADGVWARTADEVWFSRNGDIYRFDGKNATRQYRGHIPIMRIGGSADRGFAVGPGGLTIEFANWPSPAK